MDNKRWPHCWMSLKGWHWMESWGSPSWPRWLDVCSEVSVRRRQSSLLKKTWKNKYILRTYFKRIIRFQLLYYLPRDLPRVVVNMREEIIKSMTNVIFHTLQRYRAIWEFLIIRSWYLIISTYSEESWLIIWIFCTPSFSSNYDKSHLHVDNIIVIASQLQSNCQFPVASTHTLTGRQTIWLWHFCTKMRLNVF